MYNFPDLGKLLVHAFYLAMFLSLAALGLGLFLGWLLF